MKQHNLYAHIIVLTALAIFEIITGFSVSVGALPAIGIYALVTAIGTPFLRGFLRPAGVPP